MITYFILWVQVLSEMLPISSSTQVELLQQWYARVQGVPVIIPKGFDYLLHVPLLVVVPIFFARGWWGPVTMLVQRVWRRERLQSWSTHQLLMIMGKIIGLIFVCGIVAEGFHQALKFVGDCAWLRPVGLVVTALLLFLTSFLRKDGSRIGVRDDKKGFTLGFKIRKIYSLLFYHPGRSLPSATIEGSGIQHNFSPWHILWIVGIAQAFAFLPGISRMGATVTVAILCGLSVRRSLEFSFALQYPLVLAAVLLRGLPWLCSAEAAAWVQPLLLVHLVLAGVVSYGLLKLAAYLFATRRAWVFGGYVALCGVWLIMR